MIIVEILNTREVILDEQEENEMTSSRLNELSFVRDLSRFIGKNIREHDFLKKKSLKLMKFIDEFQLFCTLYTNSTDLLCIFSFLSLFLFSSFILI